MAAAASGHSDSHCDVCEKDVPSVRPHPGLKFVPIVVVWPALVLAIFFHVLAAWGALGVTVLAPTLLFVGAFALSPVLNMIHDDWRCPDCKAPVRPHR